MQDFCASGKIKWYQHALVRMEERDISRADVINCILTGEIIEDYPDDFPNPSCLVFGNSVNGRIIHVVASTDESSIGIISTYFPSTEKFETDLKTRKVARS